MEEELSQLSGKEALEPARVLLTTSLDSPGLIQGLAASSKAPGRKHVPLGPTFFQAEHLATAGFPKARSGEASM